MLFLFVPGFQVGIPQIKLPGGDPGFAKGVSPFDH